MTAIEAQELTKSYADGTFAVKGVSFTVGHGEIFGCLGRNGAGKSTTVRMLATLSRPTSGQARILGHDVVAEQADVRRLIGVSMQEAALDDLMTGREHLELLATLCGLRSAAARVRVDDLLERFGLTDAADRVTAAYSVGMRRRLDAALALLPGPAVLFLDEPTTGLDPQSRRALWKQVTDFRDEGGTVLLTTQYLDEADALCDRVAILERGEIGVLDTPQALKRRLGGKVVRVPVDDAAARQRAADGLGDIPCRLEDGALLVDVTDGDELIRSLHALGAAGVDLTAVTVSDPTLEDAFVRLTGAGLDDRGGSDEAVGVAAIGRSVATARGGSR
ncbi:MAG: ATP-binding cassette domain-containing protein [Streptomyces sp.]|nr:ATP-binding cassette domain-containing protein [Streptomyces sp.]